MRRHLLATVLVLSALSLTANAACDRSPRSVAYEGKAANVYVSPEQWAEVDFPEDIHGVSPETPEGLIWKPTPFADKLRFSAETAAYSGNFLVHSMSGQTYLIKLLGRAGCADTQVSIALQGPEITKEPTKRDAKAKRKSLIEFMLDDQNPPGYREVFAPGTKEERLVFRQGTVRFYLYKQFVGSRYVGTVFQVENKGRTPVRVAIESIDYSSPEVRKAFGLVREITMLPTSLRLGPAPEFVSDRYGFSSEGILFVASEKQGGGR